MTGTKCLVIQPIAEAGLALLRDAGIEPVPCPASDMATVARFVPGCAAVITRNAGFSAEAIRAGTALKVISVHGAGYDPVDTVEAAARGIVVCTTPGTNARSVAELALGLALACARRILDADRAVRAGEDGFREAHGFVELSGKTALIVGWGHTGSALGAMLAQGMGMRVLAHSPRTPEIAGAERVASLAEGLARADLISLHRPQRPGAPPLLDATAFAAMRPGTLLVNTARAGLIDETALIDALETGRVGACGLDVASPGARGGRLGRLPGVVLTPHLGGTSDAALDRTALAAARNVIDVLAGKRPESALPPTR